MPGPFTSVHTISWNANTESDLAGYYVLLGRVSTVYDPEIDVGLVTSYAHEFTSDGQWFIAVQAYDNATPPNVSEPSTEISAHWRFLGNF